MRRIALVVLALGLGGITGVRADTLNVAADAKTSSEQPTVNFGLLPAMAVRQAPTGTSLKSYVRFDFSALPDDPTVEKAVLRLFVFAVLDPGTIEVVPLAEPWQERTVTAVASPVAATPVASFAVETAHSLRFVDVDITDLVKDWASGARDNHGLVLRGAESGSVSVVFDTKESIVTSHAPEVEVVLSGVGEQGPPGRDGTSVTNLVEPAGPNCAGGGSRFTVAGPPTFACNGSNGATGATGAPGSPGTNGVSVTSTVEPAGTNCANAGSKFTAANGVTYACNGATGPQGPPGDTGPQTAIQFVPHATAAGVPVCGAGTEGTVYYDTDFDGAQFPDRGLCSCNGTDYVSIADGTTACN